MNSIPCIVTRDLNAQQGIWDAEAEEAAANATEQEAQWEQLWDELDAALHAGILSADSYNAIRQAMDEDLKR